MHYSKQRTPQLRTVFLQLKFFYYRSAKTLYISTMFFPDSVHNLHIRLFVFMHYPISKADHLDHLFGKSLGNDLPGGQYFEYLRLS